jgi:hypothetical protein
MLCPQVPVYQQIPLVYLQRNEEEELLLPDVGRSRELENSDIQPLRHEGVQSIVRPQKEWCCRNPNGRSSDVEIAQIQRR